jgi:hypothetical protein
MNLHYDYSFFTRLGLVVCISPLILRFPFNPCICTVLSDFSRQHGGLVELVNFTMYVLFLSDVVHRIIESVKSKDPEMGQCGQPLGTFISHTNGIPCDTQHCLGIKRLS